MSVRFNRPAGQYNGSAQLTNRFKYEQDESEEAVIDAVKVDGDLNYIVDSLNTLDDDINGVVAGTIPGSSTAANANKLLTTNGAGTLSWVDVGSTNVSQYGLTLDRLQTGTTGEMITWDVNSHPATIAVGNAGDVLTSNGPGKAPTFSNTAIFNKNGDTMQGSLGLYTTWGGTNGFENGTGNGASYTTYNMKVTGQYGWGFSDNNENVNGFYDFTTGKWDVKGGYSVNGTDVVTLAGNTQLDLKVRAYVYVDGTGTAVRHYGISTSVVYSSTGYTITFTNPFPDTNYFVAVGSGSGSNTADWYLGGANYKTTGSCVVQPLHAQLSGSLVWNTGGYPFQVLIFY